MSKIKVTYKASKASELTFTEQAAKVLSQMPFAPKKVPLQGTLSDAAKQAAKVLTAIPKVMPHKQRTVGSMTRQERFDAAVAEWTSKKPKTRHRSTLR